MGDDLVCGVDPAGEVKNINDYGGDADGIIDFSFHGAIPEIADYAVKRGLPLVVCTTGHTPEELSKINEAAKSVPVFFSANMCIGIAVLCRLAKEAVKYFPDADIEIIEKHHNRKLDAPSGTALAIADGINDVLSERKEYVYDRHAVRQKRDKKEIGIHAVRGGTIVGVHEVLFAGNDETITISHSAASKNVFAESVDIT